MDVLKALNEARALIVRWGGDGAGIHYVFELSQTRVPDNEDGEDWKTEDQRK